MQLNPSKCQVLQITKRANPLNTKYILHNVEIESVSAAKNIVVTIEDDLSWTKHIDFTTRKANQTFGFLKRNIRVHKKDLKSVAYKTLVRPQLEYTSTVWYPHTTTDINKVEAVQRRAARRTTRDYRYTSSITAMLKDLNRGPLDERRNDSRLMMMYKVTYDLVAIPASLLFETPEYQDTPLHWHTERSRLSKTITGSHSFPELSSIGMPSLSTYVLSLAVLSAG